MRDAVRRILAAGVLTAAACGPALALGETDSLRIIDLKQKCQEIKLEAVKVKDAARSPESKASAQEVIDRLDQIFSKLEDMLVND
jgi:hypothetical protein